MDFSKQSSSVSPTGMSLCQCLSSCPPTQCRFATKQQSSQQSLPMPSIQGLLQSNLWALEIDVDASQVYGQQHHNENTEKIFLLRFIIFLFFFLHSFL